jgi:predicted secreted protein
MTPSDTDVEMPFSVVEAATAAVPTPNTAPTHPDNARLVIIRTIVSAGAAILTDGFIIFPILWGMSLS